MEKKSNTKIEVYELDSYHRSNQDTSLLHKPAINSGEWVESGDLIADNSSSFQGELAIGKNILVAYMPWEGYNYEDSILINERLVYDDAYTSVHIERYEIEVRESLQGSDRITKEIPDIPISSTEHLDNNGIAKIGSWIQEGDILVGKVTPINPKKQTGYQRLIYKLFDKKAHSVRDSSLRAPKGIKANVISVQILDYISATGAPDSVGHVTQSVSDKAKAKPSRTGELSYNNLAENLRVNSTKGKKAALFERKGVELQAQVPNSQIINFDSSWYGGPMGVKTQNAQENGGPKIKLCWALPARRAAGLSSLKKSQSYSGPSYAGECYGPIWQKNAKFGLIRGAKDPGHALNTKTLANIYYNPSYANPSTSRLPSNTGGLKKPAINNASLSSLSGAGAFSYGYPGNMGSIEGALFGGGQSPPPNISPKPNFSNSSKKKQVAGSINNSKTQALRAQEQNFVPTSVQLYLAEKRKIQVGDKMAGRHGNKGIISNILPRQDMPYLPDGTPLDIVLNPLGVPSRMNVGQIYECLLGFAGKYLGEHYKVLPFDEIYGPEASRSFVFAKLLEARQKTGIEWLFNPDSPGKIRIFDGRTAESFDQPVTVGIAYMLKLVHMVDDKIHCLTPDHDVLTTNGWIPINKVTTQHQVATLTKQGELVYQKPLEVFSYPDYKGPMYRVKNANLDLFVTTNHRMYVRNGRISGENFESYELIEAQNIKGKHKKYLKNAKWTKPPYEFYLPPVMNNSIGQIIPAKAVDMEAWLTFFGLWIAEGWTCSNGTEISTTKSTLLEPKAVYRVQICQVKLPVLELIIKSVQKLGYSFYMQDNKVTIHNKQLFNYLQPLSVGAPNKYLPDWVWSLNKDQCRTLLNAMILGDGSHCGTSARYYTSSVHLKNDVMRLALHAEWSGNAFIHNEAGQPCGLINGRQITSQYDIWRIAIIKSKNSPAVNHGHQQKQNVQVEEMITNYAGSVHCLSVPNEVFYVRRNGLPVWTGNSRSTGPYSLVTQQPLRGRAKHGGQRLGEMEVWAIEGYGAAFVLLEMLTLKSDDMTGRLKLWSDLILNKDIRLGTPESFKVLICELQALCLDIGLYHFEPKKTKGASRSAKSQLLSQKPNMLNKLGSGRPKHILKEISHLMFMP